MPFPKVPGLRKRFFRYYWNRAERSKANQGLGKLYVFPQGTCSRGNMASLVGHIGLPDSEESSVKKGGFVSKGRG